MNYVESKWQPFMGDCSLCAEILAEKNNYSPWIVVKYLDALLRGFGQVIFSNNPVSGFLFLFAFICVSPIKAAVAIITGTIGIIWSVIIGHKPSDVSAGVNTYNPILLGCFAHHAVPTIFSNYHIHIWITLIIGVIICVYLNTAINGYLSKWNVPSLTLPFIFVEYLLIVGVFNNYTNVQQNNLNPESTTEVLFQNVPITSDNIMTSIIENNITKQELPSSVPTTFILPPTQLSKGDENNMSVENITTSSIKMIASPLLEKDKQNNETTTSERTNHLQQHLVTNITTDTAATTMVDAINSNNSSSNNITTSIKNNSTTTTADAVDDVMPAATSIFYNDNINMTTVETVATTNIHDVTTNLSTYSMILEQHGQPSPMIASYSSSFGNITNDTQIDNNDTTMLMENNDTGVNSGKIFAGTVHSAGALIAIDSTFLSAVIYLAITIYSPIMGACSFIGAFIGTITSLLLLNVSIDECAIGLWGYNSLLISAALCGMTWIIKLQTILACIFCIWFSVLIQYGLNFIFNSTTLLQYNLAFNIGVMSFLCMTQMLGNSFPQPAEHSFPEKHRYDYVNNVQRQLVHDRDDDEFYVKRVSIVKFGTDDSHLVVGSAGT
ncbi:uncharacterized protein LOC123304940 isoform X2 [Chrysoperla carnea]|uniref:uncharacterized protein LOC123304940 isoform X2 n=1 Tax=Chrysoperla carnea TaxID=189513 RepID=UPI001D074DE7|nr:uncharacterized protein LOC123304940 isoform X2 [Chrysoperla carnea]